MAERTADFIAAVGLAAKTWKPEADVLGPFSDPRYGFPLTDSGGPGVEILAVAAPKKPTKAAMKNLWNARQAGQALHLVLVCLPEGSQSAYVIGPSAGDLDPHELPLEAAAELLRGAAAKGTHAEQSRFLATRLVGIDDEAFAGIRNRYLFADHTLAGRVRGRGDWADAAAEGAKLSALSGRALVEALGFKIDDSIEGGTLSLLRTGAGGARAVAVFLNQEEGYDQLSGRFPAGGPVSSAIARARLENLPFVLVTQGSEIRLYQAAERSGVGRRDAAETYVQADMSLLADDERGFLPLIFSARALVEGGSFDEILEESRNYSADLSSRLRERVYVDVVPRLAVAIANARDGAKEEDLELLYEQAMVTLFRLLFVAYAEDRDLLPYRQNRAYHANSLKALALELAERESDSVSFAGDTATDLWTRVGLVWEAVDIGNPGWGVPAYNGGLFAADSSPAAAALADVELPNEAFGPALAALLVEPGDPSGPVDFRTLSVRDFGTVYEGLLESSISIASDDLVVDKAGNYVPAGEDEEPEVRAGEIYHHNRSGARKSSGSYFTKEFAVEHLLDHALEPALDAHLERLKELLNAGKVNEAGDALFDFRCADIAMGSGHFLVAATDRIELRLAEFLEENEIPRLGEELAQLRASARSNLGDAADYYEIDDRMLLRRLVARRCVYGVDINHIAVELARLALWVHTFVPGLPLSFLDHNLVCGNALTGIGTIEEAVDFLTEDDQNHGQISVFDEPIRRWIDEASEPLRRLARSADANASELAEVKAAQQEATERTKTVAALFDLICSMRRGEAEELFSAGLSEEVVRTHPGLQEAIIAGQQLGSLHFPIAFPEVFLRVRPGFDCIIGNPPWEQLRVQEDEFWARHVPGYRSMKRDDQKAIVENSISSTPQLGEELNSLIAESERQRSVISSGPFPEIGRGYIDLYKVFGWRFFGLTRAWGSFGIVLPRSSISSLGGETWRRTLLRSGEFTNVTTLVNRAGWVFDAVFDRYTVALVAFTKRPVENPSVEFIGPFGSYEEYAGGRDAGVRVAVADFEQWSEGASFPLLPSIRSGEVLLNIRRSPSLKDGSFGAHFLPVQGDFNATADKDLFLSADLAESEGLWPVYRGSSFNLWQPDTGNYFALADPGVVVPVLQAKRLNQGRNKRSAFFGLTNDELNDEESLACMSPRIVFRDIARATDPRTVIAALVPAGRVLANTAPFLLRRGGDTRSEAALLGVMASIPFDWYARRWLELHLNFFILNSFPVPVIEGKSLERLISASARLAAVDDRFLVWAESLGAPVGQATGAIRESLIAEIDALVAAGYGLDRDDLIHIFETFHEGWDYRERLDQTLAEFDAL